MAKPNYSFEKRQREMAKKKKKEEKLREKAGRKVGDADGYEPADDAGDAPEAGSVEATGPDGAAGTP
jgi:hypothetical protein